MAVGRRGGSSVDLITIDVCIYIHVYTYAYVYIYIYIQIMAGGRRGRSAADIC